MSTSKKKPASTDFSINWFSTSIFVVVCVGLVAFYGITSNLSASVKELLTVMWAMQSGIWDSLTSNGIPSGFVVSLVIIVIILLIEHIRPWRKLQKRFRKEFWLDVIYNVLSFGFYNLLGLGLAYALIVGPFNYFLLSVFNLEYPLVYLIDQVPMWLRIVLAVICAEYVSYWAHRLQHNVDFLWHIHKIHHSSQELDVMNAQRLHWLELLWLNLSSYTVLGVIGFNAVEIMAVNFFTYFLCYFTHANVFVPIGKLKYIINSPQMHIWHHAIEIDPNRNVNYGGALSIWDWLHGTAHYPEETPADLKLGFEGVEEFPKTFIGQFVYPFRVYGEKLLGLFVVSRPASTDD